MRIAKNFWVRFEPDDGAAAVGGTKGFQFRRRVTALKALAIGFLVARDFDFHPLGKRIHNRGADAV